MTANLQIPTYAGLGVRPFINFATVETSIRQPGRSNVTPHMSITWDAGRLGIAGGQVAERLSAGDPRIELSGGDSGISINPYMMEEGEAEVVAQRLKEVLGAA